MKEYNYTSEEMLQFVREGTDICDILSNFSKTWSDKNKMNTNYFKKEDTDALYSSLDAFSKEIEKSKKELTDIANKLGDIFKICVFESSSEIFSLLEKTYREISSIHYRFRDYYEDVKEKYKVIKKQRISILKECTEGMKLKKEELKKIQQNIQNHTKKEYIIFARVLDYYNTSLKISSDIAEIDYKYNYVLNNYTEVLGKIDGLFSIINKFYDDKNSSELELEIEDLQRMKEEAIWRYIR
ncbi:MAG TPA: hypothetical protein EYP22_01690 [Methanosarcinales archaeon]|nr:hypothetical protein [Methanosarcinales archaeon]